MKPLLGGCNWEVVMASWPLEEDRIGLSARARVLAFMAWTSFIAALKRRDWDYVKDNNFEFVVACGLAVLAEELNAQVDNELARRLSKV
jgi:hypothetical protein